MSNINKSNSHIISKSFNYHQPDTIDEAVDLLAELPNSKVIAGGTDLIPKMKQRLLEPLNVINLKNLPEMMGIKETENGIWIGAITKLRTIETSQLVLEKIPLQYFATKTIGSIQIRNMGTLGGNVCNASPAADGALGLLAQGAVVHIAGLNGKKDLLISKFFKGPGSTALENNEIVTGFTVPIMGKSTGYHFISIGRMALDISTISIATTITKKDDIVESAKVALGSVAPTPLRMAEVEEFLKGKNVTDDLILKASEMVKHGIKPITDIRATAEYRREAAKGMAMEALKLSWLMEAKK